VRRITCALALAGSLYAAERAFELNGRIVPASPAAVSLFGAATPFHAETVADAQGRFRFRKLDPGSYTVAIFMPGHGERRQTIDVGPGTADAKGRVAVTIQAADSSLVAHEALRDRATVSTRQLSIPPSARHEYEDAQKKLARRDVPAAVAHLEKAVQIAPQFAAAWNNLGTIAYQTRQYARAEAHFRKALIEDPESFEALVNLGGVLINEHKLDDALAYNSDAVHNRPNDALANSQLGLTYAARGNLDLGQKYLEIAKQIDPGHFSYPQLALARIHLRRNEPAAAAEEYRDFLRRHPDAPEAAGVRKALAELGP
jgi:tetratricopeptide (TPR) repeat protein